MPLFTQINIIYVLAKILDNVFNISNTVRISLSFYNNKEEIDLLINVLKNSSNIWKEIL